MKDKYQVETGFFEDGLPYAKVGRESKILLNIDALSFEHKPPSGFMLNQFKKSNSIFLDDYTLYLVGRRPNLPDDYLMNNMAEDYAKMIRREFKEPVDIIGVSTGGQIAHFLGANHPDTIRKLVIISAAFRLSERGVEIERRAAEFFQQKKYGKSLAAIMELIYPSGLKGKIIKFFTRLIGRMMLGKIKYPNDFLVEVRADREMNFKDRLSEIKVPTLILSGELDIGYTVDDVRMTAEGISNSKLILYKGYGHNLTMSNRDQVFNDVLEFLKKD